MSKNSFWPPGNYLFMAFAIGTGPGPLAMGLSFDHFGSYRPALSVFSAMLLVAIDLLNSLRFPGAGLMLQSIRPYGSHPANIWAP